MTSQGVMPAGSCGLRSRDKVNTVCITSGHLPSLAFSITLRTSQNTKLNKVFVYFQLTEVNDKMAEATSNLSFSQPSASQMHTLQRHRDILKDYSQEFTKTKVREK